MQTVPLSSLNPVFQRCEEREDGQHRIKVDTLAEAQGVRFLCPLCFQNNGNSAVGTHQIVCWSRSRGTPDDAAPGPGRWAILGTGAHDLTLNADPPGTMRSVLLTSAGGCNAHFFITNGQCHA